MTATNENWHAEIRLGVLSHALLTAGPEQLAELRRQPGNFRGKPLPSNQLKHADDQAVLALAAVARAAERTEVDFAEWSVLAAPRFLGRATLEAQFRKFQAEGAWGVSPHTIPHYCLHSVSGLLSFLLKMQGPNFGCGGGPGGDGESLLSAATLLATEPIPGCWLVFTGNLPERLPNDVAPWQSHALAVALLPEVTSRCTAQLRVAPCRTPCQPRLRPEPEDLFFLRLADLLADPSRPSIPLEACRFGPLITVEPGEMLNSAKAA